MKHSNEQVYRDMAGPMTNEDLVKIQRVTLAWADAMEKIGNADLRVTLMACVNIIGTMGPAYCHIAASMLLKRSKDIEAGMYDDIKPH